jgi:isoleucyl-tRNA synthetase
MYDFKSIEKEVLDFWQSRRIYEKRKKKNAKGKRFYFLQGPPYTSGRIHIGHAWNNSLKDLVLRYKHLQGLHVWDRAGYDMHGLPTENAVQKKLGLKDKKEIEAYGIERFVKECIKFSKENAELMNQDLMRLGVWMDFKNAYLPVNSEFIEGEWWLIKKAWEQKRLYQDKKIMHWCVQCETSLAKHELEYATMKEQSIFVKFKIKERGDKNEYLIVWTTTPWTLAFNLAIIVHPDIEYVKAEIENHGRKEYWIIANDLAERFFGEVMKKKYKIIEKFRGKKLAGLEYVHPFASEIDFQPMKEKWKDMHTVILSTDYVHTEEGTGLVHCAPGCGPEDYEAAKRYDIGVFNLANERGIFEGLDFGKFKGWRAKQDDQKFIDDLDNREAVAAKELVEHEYPICWRCKTPLIFRPTDQWFMKIEDLIPLMLSENEKVHWIPKFTKENTAQWITNLKDNSITRQRYWGCPVPIWKCEKCSAVDVIGSIKELEKKSGKKHVPPDLHRPWIDSIKLKCGNCGSVMSRLHDVIDVWIDAGTASWNSLYFPSSTRYFKQFWPADFILEATEQIHLWFSILQICSAVAFGESSYKNVYCHGMILDYQGMKMSKSLGNVISPYEVVDKYGADILRYYLCQISAGENINFNWEDVKVKQTHLNILANLANLILDIRNQGIAPRKKFGIEEKYILSRKNEAVKRVTSLMEEYKIDGIIKEIEDLFLDLSRAYVKLTREKSADEKYAGNVLAVLEEVYVDILKMFSIVCPFITEHLYQKIRPALKLKEESVHLCSWPRADTKKINKNLEEKFRIVLKIIETGFASRDKIKIGLKWPLSSAVITCSPRITKEFEHLIAAKLNVKKIILKKKKTGSVSVDFNTIITPELEAEGYAREIARKIQAMRKDAGLEKKDIIAVEIVVHDHELSLLLKNYEKFLKKRVHAKIFDFVGNITTKYKKHESFMIKEKRFDVAF